MSINVVLISGIIDRKFDPKQLESGKSVHSAVLKHEVAEGKSASHILGAWSDFAQKQLDAASVGDKVIVNGRLSKSNYKDKTTEEWVEKYEISVNHVEVLVPAEDRVPVGAGAATDDGPFG
jgi:single-stranded DNA-binding protein